MSWYELLKTLHVLAMGLWLGSALAILVMATRARANPPVFGTFKQSAKVQQAGGEQHALDL